MIAPAPPEAALLRARIERLLRNDVYSAQLGIRVEDTAPGYAQLSMLVVPAAMNAHGSAHGGAVWTLADMAFGAAGYYDGPILTTESNLAFVRPTPPGGRLVARAREVTRRGRSAIFHVILGSDPDQPDGVFATGMFGGRWTLPGALDEPAPEQD